MTQDRNRASNPLSPDEQKQLHHDFAGCIAAIESAFACLSDPKGDLKGATELYSMAIKRLRELVERLNHNVGR